MTTGRIKSSSKAVRATFANKDVLDMFNETLTGGSASLPIMHTKYERMKEHTARFLRLLGLLRDSACMRAFPDQAAHLARYVAVLQRQHEMVFIAPEIAPPFEFVPQADIVAFDKVYREMKDCSLVNTIIVTCRNLIAYKKYIGKEDALRDKFLLKSSGSSVAPLPDLPQLNFKQLYIDPRAASHRSLLLTVLHKLHAVSHDLYEAASSPDIDSDEFARVVMASIGDIKKQVPRCNEAFDVLASCVDILRSNFGGYHKDYTASGNPTIIMENFVLDVSKATKQSPKVTAQFRRIIAHYRKVSQQGAIQPKLQAVFACANANFREIEHKNRAGAAPGPAASDDDEGVPDPANESDTDDDSDVNSDAKEEETHIPAKVLRRRRKKAQTRARARARAGSAVPAEPALGLYDGPPPAESAGGGAALDDGAGPDAPAGAPADAPAAVYLVAPDTAVIVAPDDTEFDKDGKILDAFMSSEFASKISFETP